MMKRYAITDLNFDNNGWQSIWDVDLPSCSTLTYEIYKDGEDRLINFINELAMVMNISTFESRFSTYNGRLKYKYNKMKMDIGTMNYMIRSMLQRCSEYWCIFSCPKKLEICTTPNWGIAVMSSMPKKTIIELAKKYKLEVDYWSNIAEQQKEQKDEE